MGADPIFDAQDFPPDGFELASYDPKTHFVVVRAKEWPEFEIAMKMVSENNQWLVDGCGIVNIPVTEQRAR